MIRFNFNVDLDDLEIAKAIMKRGGERGIRDCAHLLLAESKKQVPHEEGTLERSGMVDSEGMMAHVSYGERQASAYAVIQHEATHFKHQSGRKAKYLEDPCNDPALKARMLEYLKNDINF